MFDILNESNFVLFAAKHYDNPQCHDTEEFFDDLKRFKYLRRLFGKYEDSGELKERLILNHIVILYNTFGPEATRMLFYKLNEYRGALKPFLLLLSRMPDSFLDYDGSTTLASDIRMDWFVVDKLRKI